LNRPHFAASPGAPRTNVRIDHDEFHRLLEEHGLDQHELEREIYNRVRRFPDGKAQADSMRQAFKNARRRQGSLNPFWFDQIQTALAKLLKSKGSSLSELEIRKRLLRIDDPLVSPKELSRMVRTFLESHSPKDHAWQFDQVVKTLEHWSAGMVEQWLLSEGGAQLIDIPYYSTTDLGHGRVLFDALASRAFDRLAKGGCERAIVTLMPSVLGLSYRYGSLQSFWSHHEKDLLHARGLLEKAPKLLRCDTDRQHALFGFYDYYHLTLTTREALTAVEGLRNVVLDDNAKFGCGACIASWHCSACSAVRIREFDAANDYLENSETELALATNLHPEEKLLRRGYVNAIRGKSHFLQGQLEESRIQMNSAECAFRESTVSEEGSPHWLAIAFTHVVRAEIAASRGETKVCRKHASFAMHHITASHYSWCCLFEEPLEDLKERLFQMSEASKSTL
jgi:hypothetical protein